MPYYIHKKTETQVEQITYWTNAVRCPTARLALEALVEIFPDKTHKVTYVETAEEMKTWQDREESRFSRSIDRYVRVPWELGNAPDPPEGLGLHYAHLCLKTPGLIAYTKTPEQGYQDKQTSVKPGRYLQEYWPDLDATLRDRWIAECSTDLTLSIATSVDEIREVYMNGPSSCMDGAHWKDGEMSCSIHPSAVYADSDLAVAYFGSLSKPKARCVVWPAKKRYSRIYGDSARLILLMENAGYRKNALEGARVRAIREGDGWLMPYIDYFEHGMLSSDRQWISFNEGGSICIQNVSGCTGKGERERDECSECGHDCDDCVCATCSRCDDTYDSDINGGSNNDGDCLCGPCYRHLRECSGCDFTDDDRDTEFDGGLCPECISARTHTCEACDDSWTDNNTDDARICPDCKDKWMICHSCDKVTEITDDPEPCSHCGISERCDKTTDLLAEASV